MTNMFIKLVDYFCKYQNEHIKHNDAVNEDEIDFLIVITTIFMKHIIKLSKKSL